jgi:hypothetical protein
MENELSPMMMAKYEKAISVWKQIGTVKETCRHLGISYQTWKNWKKCPVFQEMYEMEHEDLCRTLEAEAFHRAVEGEDEDIYFQGQVVGSKKKKSDYLLFELMKANMREKYGTSVNVANSGDLKIQYQGAIEQFRTARLEIINELGPNIYQRSNSEDTDTDPLRRISNEGPEDSI